MSLLTLELQSFIVIQFDHLEGILTSESEFCKSADDSVAKPEDRTLKKFFDIVTVYSNESQEMPRLRCCRLLRMML